MIRTTHRALKVGLIALHCEAPKAPSVSQLISDHWPLLESAVERT